MGHKNNMIDVKSLFIRLKRDTEIYSQSSAGGYTANRGDILPMYRLSIILTSRSLKNSLILWLKTTLFDFLIHLRMFTAIDIHKHVTFRLYKRAWIVNVIRFGNDSFQIFKTYFIIPYNNLYVAGQ